MRLSPVVRGFLAFVAFMEFVNALRSLIPSLFALPSERLAESFVQGKVFSLAVLGEQGAQVVAHLFGLYSLHNSAILLHAIVVFSKPSLLLALVILSSKCLFYLLQGFYYSTIPVASFQVALLISVLALVGVVVLLCSGSWDSCAPPGDENADLVKAMRFGKARKAKQL